MASFAVYLYLVYASDARRSMTGRCGAGRDLEGFAFRFHLSFLLDDERMSDTNIDMEAPAGA
jgi:hypothetical protein